jgi:hypothetical protein
MTSNAAQGRETGSRGQALPVSLHPYQGCRDGPPTECKRSGRISMKPSDNVTPLPRRDDQIMRRNLEVLRAEIDRRLKQLEGKPDR